MDPPTAEKEKEAHMRRLLPFLPLLFVIMWLVPSDHKPNPWIPADSPAQTDTPEDGQQAFLMNAPNCFLMADGTQKCAADPTSGSTVALKIWRKPQQLALTCFLRKLTSDISILGRKPSGVTIGMRHDPHGVAMGGQV